MRRKFVAALSASILVIGGALPLGVSAAGPRTVGTANDAVETSTPRVGLALRGATGRIDAVVRLVGSPTATVKGAAAQRARAARLVADQARLVAELKRLDPTARIIGRTRVTTNTLLVTADARALERLAADPGVAGVARPRHYELDLSETVPYIGARTAPADGYTGAGIVVAVLDSGIDYTHVAFGGPGTAAAYRAAYGTRTGSRQNQQTNSSVPGASFPTAKVIGGYDFVGEKWPDRAEDADPDPIDCSPTVIGCDGGHGTHVADIIAGETSDATSGVAPDAKLLAVKVCSAIASSCSGIALLQGMDFAVDPDGDGDTEDAADIINMSLGSSYGQSGDDSLSTAVESATAAGVLVVASAGNSGDKPYATGTPAGSPSSLSVAQTEVPSASGFAMEVDVSGTPVAKEAVFQDWSLPLSTAITGTAQYGNGAGGNLNGCVAFPAGSLTGKIVLVDRGTCNFSLKIANIAAGGAALGIIGLIAPGDPFTGSLGDCPSDLCREIPGYMISQADSALLKTGVSVTFDPANVYGLVRHMVGSSARGPDMWGNLIKPEIGAPGASVSAVVGTGTGTESFGGTSGAAPMVAGAAALVLEAHPTWTPLEVKAALMTTADDAINNRPTLFGGELAPITRIGGGEVRVDAAVATETLAWVDGTRSSALSFGFRDVSSGTLTLTKTVRVKNVGASPKTYSIGTGFRYTDDLGKGVSVSAPSSITVGAGSSDTFDVTLTVDPAGLRAWTLDSGLSGADPGILQTLEYDGYVTIAGGGDAVHLPWQVLPRKAGAVSASSSSVAAGTDVTLTNGGAGTAWLSHFDLLVSETDVDATTGSGDDVADVDLRHVGLRQYSGSDATSGLGCTVPLAMQFAISTWGRQTHALAPAIFEIDLFVGRDPNADAAILSADRAGIGSLSDGRATVWAVAGRGDPVATSFPVIHPTNGSNTVLTVCGEDVGLTAASVGRTVRAQIFAFDWYNSGSVRDVANATFVVGRDRFSLGSAIRGSALAGNGSTSLAVTDFGTTGRTAATGLLVLTDHSLLASDGGASGGAAPGFESIVLTVTPAAPGSAATDRGRAGGSRSVDGAGRAIPAGGLGLGFARAAVRDEVGGRRR